MRTLRLFAHVSIDGVIAPGGRHAGTPYADGGWTAPFRSPEGAPMIADAQGERYDLILGRRTYDLWSGHWPKQTGGLFADRMNAATKHVATHRPDSLAWGPARPLGPNVAGDVRALKATPGPDLIVWGSTTITPTLLTEGLVDEVLLAVYPVLLGAGKRLFPDTAAARHLALVSARSTSSGVLFNTYRHTGPLAQPE